MDSDKNEQKGMINIVVQVKVEDIPLAKKLNLKWVKIAVASSPDLAAEKFVREDGSFTKLGEEILCRTFVSNIVTLLKVKRQTGQDEIPLFRKLISQLEEGVMDNKEIELSNLSFEDVLSSVLGK